MKNKTFLFIDGSNLYGGQYELFGPKRYIHFSKLIEKLEDNINVSFDEIYFYTSYSPKSKKPTAREKLFLKNEAFFYRSVRDTKHVIFFKGYRSKTSRKEKEVDVKLTADLVSLGFLNKFHVAYLFTGDADFLQALFTLQKTPKKKDLYILSLQNKIMHKGAFYFPTLIVAFEKIHVSFHAAQKIKVVTISATDVLRDV